MTAMQGTCDYLCGLYSLVNDLAAYTLDGPEGPERTAFEMLVRSAGELGYIDANHLLYGFEAYELIAIFNLTADNHRIPRRAVHLADFVEGNCQRVSRSEVSRVFGLGGSIIWYKSKENHWVLVANDTGEWVDSLGGKRVRRVKKIDLNDPEICVAILPYDKVPN